MRRRVAPAIVADVERVQTALAHCRVELSQATALAMLVLAVEQLEDMGRTAEELRAFFDHVLDAPVPLDPRADTRGT